MRTDEKIKTETSGSETDENRTPRLEGSKRPSILTVSPISAPLLAAVIMILMSISRAVIADGAKYGKNVFLVISIIQLIVFLLPCIIYYQIKGRKLDSPMYLRGITLSQLIMSVVVILFLLSGNLLIKYISFAIGGTATSVTVYYSSVNLNADGASNLFIIISLCIVPAVCEELFFRGVVMSEYRAYGNINAVIMSALCFAMLHFSAENFFSYLFFGLVFGMVTAVTRSVFPSIILHAVNNVFCIYGSDLFIRIIVQEAGIMFLGLVIISLFGLASIFLLAQIEHVYRGYAKNPPVTELPAKNLKNIPLVFISPAFIGLVVVFLLISVLNR